MSSLIAYDRAGPRGDVPVVLVHAGIADRRMWDPLWPGLTDRRDALRVDLRGFGDSDTPPDGPLDPVADLLAVLGAEGVDRAHLVGASFGAGVVVEAALARPGLAASLVLAPPGGSLLAELTPSLKAFFEAEAAALDADDLDAAVAANLDTWVVGPTRSRADVAADVLDAVAVMQRRAFEVTLPWGDLEEVEADPPALDRLGELDVPLLVLLGRHDLDTSHDAAQRVAAGAPAVRRVDWSDVAHLPSLEKPVEFAALLSDWLAESD